MNVCARYLLVHVSKDWWMALQHHATYQNHDYNWYHSLHLCAMAQEILPRVVMYMYPITSLENYTYIHFVKKLMLNHTSIGHNHSWSNTHPYISKHTPILTHIHAILSSIPDWCITIKFPRKHNLGRHTRLTVNFTVLAKWTLTLCQYEAVTFSNVHTYIIANESLNYWKEIVIA